MKIALVILHADAARGGAERYTLDLAAGLAARGHDVTIFASSFQPETPGTAVLIGTTANTRTGRYAEFLEKLDARLSAEAFDVVHAMLPVKRCDVYHPHAGVAVDGVRRGHLTKSNALNRALSWIGNRLNRRRNRFAAVELELLNSDRPPVVLCLSNLIRDVVRRNYPALPAERLIPLFNGVDLGRFDPWAGRESRRLVRDRYGIAQTAVIGLMLAQDFERKGLGPAIEALAKVRDENLILLVGGRPDPTRYQRLAKSLGVGERVIFAGAVRQPATIYQAADFFVLPTRFDPCSLVVLEALAMGLPVISTAKNGACEVMEDGVHGRILADADDIDGLAAAMKELLDSKRREAMSQACRALRPKLSQSAHLDQLEAVYRRLITERSSSHGQ